MTRDEYEKLLAIELWRQDQYFDPTDDADFDVADLGWSKLDSGIKEIYQSIANRLYVWIATTPLPES